MGSYLDLDLDFDRSVEELGPTNNVHQRSYYYVLFIIATALGRPTVGLAYVILPSGIIVSINYMNNREVKA